MWLLVSEDQNKRGGREFGKKVTDPSFYKSTISSTRRGHSTENTGKSRNREHTEATDVFMKSGRDGEGTKGTIT